MLIRESRVGKSFKAVSIFFLLVLMSFGLGWSCQDLVCRAKEERACRCVQAEESFDGKQICALEGFAWEPCQCDMRKKKGLTQKEPNKEPDDEVIYSEELPFSISDAGVSPPFVPASPKIFRPPATNAKPLERISIDMWPWGAEAAISLTVDDGLREPFEKLAPEFEKRSWRGTFFICTEMAEQDNSWKLIQKAEKAGHEIGNHTHTHRDLKKLSEQELKKELETSIALIQKHLGWDFRIFSFAFPYESSNRETGKIVWDYHRYLRGGDHGVLVPPNPVPLNDAFRPDFQFLMAKAPVRIYNVSRWNDWVDVAVKEQKWLIEELHGVDEKGWEPRTMTEYREHFDYIQKYAERVWIAPMGQVGRFINERQTLKIEVKVWGKGKVSLLFSNRFEKHFTKKERVLVSFVFQPPKEWLWENLKAKQQGQTRKVKKLAKNVFRIEVLPFSDAELELSP